MTPSLARLTLIATPIGNLADLSPHAAEALTAADFWLVEDSRVSGKLASHLGLKKPMRILNDHTGEPAMKSYLAELRERTAALITDGGAPAISDPGARLCDLCHEAGLGVDAAAGPSAVTTALMLSGFYAQRFAFLGFLGRKRGAIREELEPFRESPMTLVLFESPHRFRVLLEVAGEVFGDRRYALCREMTKMHQQVYRSRLPSTPTEAEMPAKGELTVVIEGLRRALPSGKS